MSRAMEERLVECVRGHECLYNYKLQQYKDAALKQEVWEQIATELKATASDCKAKWNLLRNAFVHAVSRRKTTTGQGVKNYKKWKYEDEMSFLLPFMANRNTFSNIDESKQDPGPIEEDKEHSQKSKRKDNYQEQILNIMNSKSQRKTDKDDIDLFFETMAKTVKKFPKIEQIKLKLDVMKMVHELEIRFLDYVAESSASTSRISATSTPSPPLLTRRTSSPYSREISASPSYVQFSPSPQNTHQSSVTQQSPSHLYTDILQPSTSRPRNTTTEDSFVEQLILSPEIENEVVEVISTPMHQQSDPYYGGPVVTGLLNEFIIVKKQK